MEDDGHVLEFRLPDLGEGLAEAEVVSWSVNVGDSVELNQTIAEVETAKAVVALPSPFAGRVEELLAEPGETVEVGAPLIRVRVESPRAVGEGAVPSSTPADETPPAEGNGHTSVLVGYGPEGEAESRRRRPAPEGRAAATPAARKLAKELGIDLWFVAGSGPDGAVTVDDVRGAVPVSQPRTAAPTTDITTANRPAPTVTEPNAGVIRPAVREERAPITGIRKRTAAAMVASARTIPQAGVFVTVDCTASMELLDHLRTTKSFAGLTLTPLALVAKATLAAIAEFPGVNAYWDEANQQIVTKHYVNLGIAVATERGLLVPNLKEAQSLSLRDLCREIGWLAETARSGSATPADLRGGTFTITNVGVFGVDTGVPLVNPGEAAILCLGSIRKRPWVFRDELAVRWVTTLGIGFDHRMIDGELAARFLTTTAGFLEDPLTLLSRM
ncbi:dihydrolipoamide acetyltransferase family protein [Nocardia amikacinitolerans]|uniref:dihydrolipoamide acetyltransferase family protein n=1 Tax=Nocardia amikacinitolerans TaxID=756689 RepID=UPI0036B085B6